ncbi:hypothetical protein QFZ67_007653 [Streptomyces sp. V1I1]|nr:hypothetical protein [Streptomyces sp. V1I1]
MHVCTAPDDHAVAAAPAAVVSRRQPAPPAGQDPDTEVMALCIARCTVRQVTCRFVILNLGDLHVAGAIGHPTALTAHHKVLIFRAPAEAALTAALSPPEPSRLERGAPTQAGGDELAVGARRMTTPYFADDAATLCTGDAVEVLSELPDGGADLVVISPRTGDCATTAPPGGVVATPRAYIRPGGTPSASPGRTAVRNRSCRRGVCSQALAVSSPGVRWRH